MRAIVLGALAAIAASAACSAAPPDLLIIGHRGAPAERLENSIASFERAKELGADGVELDVQRTSDNRLIVMHDPTLDRTSTCTGVIGDSTLEEITTKCALLNGEPVRELGDVLARIAPLFPVVFVDIKLDDGKEPIVCADETVRVVLSLGLADKVVISSTNVTAGRQLATHRTAGIRGGSDAFTDAAIGQASRAGLDWVLLRLDAIDGPEALMVRGLDKRLCVYSINTPDEYTTASEAGIDVMMTDSISLVRALAGRPRIRTTTLAQ